MVYYRKYRPQTINDLDNQAVRETLFSVLKKSASHAFLFTGPKGLGKTSTARIIAKVVNCTTPAKARKEGIEPCNTCDQCVSITNGNNMDVLEIDAASNRGIDEIRDLKEKIRLSPASAKMKVYIIDEVHMLTTEAFNALLKTLEEPPSHAMFILCTTEPHKVPATIISRCLHINFHLATDEEIVRSLKRVVVGEEITVDDKTLLKIAGMADGGFRDATKFLEELAALATDKRITPELIEERYQLTSITSQITGVLDALVAKDAKAGLEIVGVLVQQGIDMKYFLQQLLETLHEELLAQAGVDKKTVQTKLTLEEITYLFALFSKAYTDMKSTVLPQLPLELAIIEYTMQESGESTPIETQTPIDTDKGVTVSSLRKKVGTIKKIQALYGEEKTVPVAKIATSTVELMHAFPDGAVTKEWLAMFWQQIIVEMKKHNHTVAGVLRGCSIKNFDKEVLIIETIYKFHKERLDDAKTRDVLMGVCKLLTGKNIEIRVELGK